MSLILNQTDGTTLTCGTVSACATGTVSATPIQNVLEAGGTLGSTEQTTSVPSDSTRLTIFMQSEPIAAATWDAGDWVVRFNITTSQMDTNLLDIYICRMDSECNSSVVASDEGINTSIAGGGVFTRTIAAAESTGNENDSVYIVVRLNNTNSHTDRSVGITPDQAIDTPIVPAGGETLTMDKGGFSLSGKALSFDSSIPVDKGGFTLIGHELLFQSGEQYWTDFSEYTTGQLPNDWTKIWDPEAADITVEEVAEATGGKVFRFTNSAGTSNRHMAVWDTPGDALQWEMFARVKVTGDLDSKFNGISLHVRASGTSSNRTAYSGARSDGGSSSGRWNSYEALNQTFNFDNTNTFSVAQTSEQWYILGLKVDALDNANVEMKVWRDGVDTEPAWISQSELTDFNIPTGKAGIGGVADLVTEWDWVGVGVNGASAPRESLGGNTIEMDKGAFSLSGHELFQNLSVVHNKGEFALNGHGLLQDLSTSISPGSFTQNGYSTTLNLSILADNGNFTLDGKPLFLNSSLPLDKAGFDLTGYEVEMAGVQAILMGKGSFLLDGKNLSFDSSLLVGNGSFTLNGHPASFDSSLLFYKGNFTLNGKGLSFNTSIPTNKGTFSINGYNLFQNLSTQIQKGSFALNGYDLLLRTIVQIDKGAFILTGYTLEFAGEKSIVMSPGSFLLDGKPLSFSSMNIIEKGGFDQQGYDLSLHTSILIDKGVFIVDGKDLGFNFPPLLADGSFSITLFTPLILDKGSFTTNGHDLGFNLNSPINKEVFSLNGYELFINTLIPVNYVISLNSPIRDVSVKSTIRDIKKESTVSDISVKSTVKDISIKSIIKDTT